MKLNDITLVAILALLIGFTSKINAQIVNGSLLHDGENREYFYYLPANYTGNTAVPLIINLHGHTSNNTQQHLYTNFEPIADTAGFIMVYPQGLNSVYSGMPFWNYGIFLETADDLGFLNKLLDTLMEELNIDPSRVYCTGMSNGGFMSYYMALYSDRFAAVVSVTGSMAKTENGVPPTPIPIMEIHGTADGSVPYNGDITMRPIEEVVNKWVNWNQCNPTPVMTPVPDSNPNDGATAEHYVYSGGINGNTVEFYKVIDGGHTWPGASIPIGVTCQDFDASKEIWRFFSQYSRTDLLSVAQVEELSFTVFPNPVSEVVNIEVPLTQYEGKIIDIQGKVVMRFREDETKGSIDVSGLESGIYVVELSGEGRIGRKKVVK